MNVDVSRPAHLFYFAPKDRRGILKLGGVATEDALYTGDKKVLAFNFHGQRIDLECQSVQALIKDHLLVLRIKPLLQHGLYQEEADHQEHHKNQNGKQNDLRVRKPYARLLGKVLLIPNNDLVPGGEPARQRLFWPHN